MIKKVNIIHKTINIISWCLVLIGIIRLCLLYNSLPNQVGVHFAADGSFDVIVNKSNLLYIGYPYIISIIIILLSDLFIYLSNKIRLGLKINNDGENIIRSLFN